MTPIVFLDVDGVLVNFDEVAVETINRTYGTNHPLDTKPLTWGFRELIPEGADPSLWWPRLPENWTRIQSPYPGAVEFTHALHEAGARVILLTKCSEALALARIANLNENGFYYDEFYAVPYHGFNKSDYINTIMEHRFPDSPWVFVDDAGQNVTEVAKNGPPVHCSRILTLAIPYNYVDHLTNEPNEFAENDGKLFTVCYSREDLYAMTLDVVRADVGTNYAAVDLKEFISIVNGLQVPRDDEGASIVKEAIASGNCKHESVACIACTPDCAYERKVASC